MGTKSSDKRGRFNMNIRDAKQNIKQTIQMYLAKNEDNNYMIPIQRQRPLFLYGPPGIGKTEIVSQVCSEMNIGLINYTITHHTRQSAIGLPTIQDITYGNDQYKITEYTLSEIINSVYHAIHHSGMKEGVLFIDEVNCVSESLAPAMLDLLQNKKFGPHRIPEGWILITAGNPLEYNRSARAFDMVTLDRLKVIEITAEFDSWKKYAYKKIMNESVVSFLNVREHYLFKVEKTVDGLSFATPRGWEDLSVAINMYHDLNYEVKHDLITQYIQHEEISKEFYRYYLLHQKYKRNLNIEQIMNGNFEHDLLTFREASFEEKLAVIEVLLNSLNVKAKIIVELNEQFKNLVTIQKRVKFKNDLKEIDKEIEHLKYYIKNHEFDVENNKKKQNFISYLHQLVGINSIESLDKHINEFKHDIDSKLALMRDNVSYTIEFVFECHGESQELVALIVNILSSIHMMKFMHITRVPIFDEYNSKFVTDDKSAEIMKDIRNYEEQEKMN